VNRFSSIVITAIIYKANAGKLNDDITVIMIYAIRFMLPLKTNNGDEEIIFARIII